MKWVWIRPLVLQPQTKNVPNSTQKIGTRAASFSTLSGAISKRHETDALRPAAA